MLMTCNDPDASLFGEFDRVADNISDNLADHDLIKNRGRQVTVKLKSKIQPLPLR